MYSFQILNDPPALKLIVLGSFTEQELNQVLRLFDEGRKHLPKGHQAWFVLPPFPSRVPDRVFLETRLAAFRGRAKGLTGVVIELQSENPEMQALAQALRDIYVGLDIPAQITRSSVESRYILSSPRAVDVEPPSPETVALASENEEPEDHEALAYRFQALASHAVLKLTLHDTPSEQNLDEVIGRFEAVRGRFSTGYQVWIVLPSHFASTPSQAVRKVDFAAFKGRIKGLRNVVIELRCDDPQMREIAEKLREIFAGLYIQVTITHDPIESRRLLDLLWKTGPLQLR